MKTKEDVLIEQVRKEEYWSRAKPPGLPPALPVEEPALHLLFTGGKSGNRWGVGFQLQSCTPSNHQEVQEVTPTSSNCQLASQSTGKREVTEARRREERRGEEREGEAAEERRKMTRG
ncbi:KRAB domain-containing zinc finger protein [Sarotherodon galilaeus]